MNKKTISAWLCTLSFVLFLGCNPATETNPTGTGDETPAAGDEHAGHDPEAHAHPSHGPHDGDLIDLGAEEYHGELVDDHQAGTVTIYILDSSAKKTVAIAAKEVVVNLKHDGKVEQFKLAASADQGDAEGMSSRFVSSDKEFAEEINHAHSEATLVVTIKEKTFRGKIEHDHAGHQGHGHKEHDH